MIFPELYIAYVSWGNGGKTRPVLVLSDKGNIIEVYPITSKYYSKSREIQKEYFIINDWRQAGLDKQSYIDTIDIVELSRLSFDNETPIGKLSEADETRLIEFLDK